jgi:ATP-dependent RecD-like DNA helicase SH3 domain/UvrD-like helicase C-terminal domain/Helix-hairpin-helix containing domain
VWGAKICPLSGFAAAFRRFRPTSSRRTNAGKVLPKIANGFTGPSWVAGCHPDVTPARAAKITAGWADQKVLREIMVFLHQHGEGTARAVRIFKTYGTNAVLVMSENPSLNIELQAAFNPAGEKKVERFGWTFAPDDKVMQIENNYDKYVYNGDVGMITDVDLNEGEVEVEFDGRTVTFAFGELDKMVPAYAATIHKRQGSEYPAVVIPVMTQHYAMLQRNLIYTVITRSKKLVVLVGQKKAVAIAVKNVSGQWRWSKLDESLSEGSGP